MTDSYCRSWITNSALSDVDFDYDSIARDFARTASPELSAGLNLGRQLFWQQQQFPQEFNRATILPYPQYWAARLCGVRAWEPTSLGCHTYLWEPQRGDFSSLAKTIGWDARFGCRVSAWSSLGPPLPEIAERTGLSDDAYPRRNPRQQRVVSRTSRDSRRSFLRRLDGDLDRNDGARQSARHSREELDTLANVDAFGNPVPTARFMGGREYAAICGPDAVLIDPSVADLEAVLESRALPIPSFSDQAVRSVRKSAESWAMLQRRRVIQPHSRRSIVR